MSVMQLSCILIGYNLGNMYNLCKLHSLICMSSDMCDEKIDCMDLAVGRTQADQKVGQKSVSFLKRSVDHTTLAVRMTGRPYGTSAHILFKNNF